jgi:hypothetical protein
MGGAVGRVPMTYRFCVHVEDYLAGVRFAGDAKPRVH